MKGVQKVIENLYRIARNCRLRDAWRGPAYVLGCTEILRVHLCVEPVRAGAFCIGVRACVNTRTVDEVYAFV